MWLFFYKHPLLWKVARLSWEGGETSANTTWLPTYLIINLLFQNAPCFLFVDKSIENPFNLITFTCKLSDKCIWIIAPNNYKVWPSISNLPTKSMSKCQICSLIKESNLNLFVNDEILNTFIKRLPNIVCNNLTITKLEWGSKVVKDARWRFCRK